MTKLKWECMDNESGWDPGTWVADLGDTFQLVVYAFNSSDRYEFGLALWPRHDELECGGCGDTTDLDPFVTLPRTQADDADAFDAAEQMASEWFRKQAGGLL